MASTDQGGGDSRNEVPGLAVWAVSALGALLGLLLALGGLVLAGVTDRAEVAELVRTGQIRVEGMTDAQAVDLVVATAWWSGLGLLATGVLFVVASVGFLLYQRRLGRRQPVDGAGGGTVWSYALLGAFVTVLTTFLPASPLLGGGVAGYLRGGDYVSGGTVGGLSGTLAAVPMVVLLGFVFAGVVLGMPAVDAVGGRGILAAILGVVTLFVVALTVVLGGVGGLVGAFLSDDRAGET